jgi:ribonuclease P protein component
LFRDGKTFSVFPFKVFYTCGEKISSTESLLFNVQLGIGVSVRNFKKAVDRNRIKRLMRESYRLQKGILYNTMKEKNQQLAVFFIYTGKELPDYKTVHEKIGVTLQRLIKEMN